MIAPVPDRLGYRPALDGLRAVAIVMVLLVHTGAFLVPGPDRVLPGGALGVDVFFVLSGFLITTLLLERRGERRPIASFYLRRALRLLPAVVVLLVGVAVIALAEGEPARTVANTFAAVLTYTTNWAMLAGVAIERHVTHLWSLAIEEQFYAVWPLLLFSVLAARRGGSRHLLWITVAIAGASAVWRAVLWESGHPWERLYLRTDARLDSLLIGALLAQLPWRRVTRVPLRARTAAGVAALVAVLAAAETLKASSGVLYLGGYTVVALLCGVLIAAVLPGDGVLAAALGARLPVTVGRLSYSLYLWHFPLFIVVGEHTGSWSTAARIVFAWTVTFAAAAASYRWIERPALGLKARVGGRGARLARTATP